MKKKKSLLILLLPLVVLVSFLVLFFISLPEDTPDEPLPTGPIFSSKWNTTLISIGSSGADHVKLPLVSGGDYNFTVNWGDGSNDMITSWNEAEVNHTYSSGGVYTINITGIISGWRFNNGGDRLKLLKIENWGPLHLGNAGSYFYGCANLNITANDTLNLTGTTNLAGAFRGCSSLDVVGRMDEWDVSNIANMAFMFYDASVFNQEIGNWNVSSVTTMASMFYGASTFNQEIGDWDVSNVTDM